LIYTTVEYKPIGLLRDIGIIFYGYALAYLSLLGGAKIGTLLVVLSLPIFDSIRVFVNRIFVMKKSPMKKDYTHLHYRLLALGRNR
jgi:UDP-N-acetylmuramyl pentapeptide phosphotransferase/UDP-N-acetylglucosamine-1-phosphate transferase